MLISLNWLQQFVASPDNVTPKELGLKLTMATVEVDDVIDLATQLENIYVGKIEKLEKHPNADKLQLAWVNYGQEQTKVVCGGTNLKQGMIVALALPGAKARWHGEGDLLEIKKAKVRGEESNGMVCASDEIGIFSLFPHEQGEIADLSNANLKVGQPLAEALKIDDVIYDIDNKSLTNRPDLWGHYGMAREVAALYGLELKEYKKDVGGMIKHARTLEKVDLKVKVEDKKACPRYMGIAMKGIKVGESPDWLKQRLQAIGQKSINNIVDVTNYILFELGQPLHAFSADQIKNSEIIVRKAKNKEKIVTLDDEELLLTKEDLVIADKEKAVALAGIMGGLHSGINDQTESIIIEVANFEPFTVRKTSSRLGIRTESSMRFEKSLDPNLAELAIKKAVALILELCPGAEVVSELVDVANFKLDQGPIELSWEFIEQRIGQKIEQKKIVSILTSLGFEIEESGAGLKVLVPTWRATKDISIPEDIIEEITRIYGYDNLKPEMPAVKTEQVEENKLRNLENKIKNVLALSGSNEVLTYSFVERKLLEKIGIPEEGHLELENPWAEGHDLMRQTLAPNLLQAVVENLRFYDHFSLFEVGKVFINDGKGAQTRADSREKLPTQDLMLGGIICAEKENKFYVGRKVLQDLFEKLNLKLEVKVLKKGASWLHPNQAITLLVNKKEIGYFGSVHPQVAKNLEMPEKVAVWEINLTKLVALCNEIGDYERFTTDLKKYQPLPKFPAIKLDLSILVNESEKEVKIAEIIKAVDSTLIRAVELLDVFKNDKIEVGKKSVTFRIIYQLDDRTLEMEEVKKVQAKVVSQLEKQFGAKIRK